MIKLRAREWIEAVQSKLLGCEWGVCTMSGKHLRDILDCAVWGRGVLRGGC